MSTCIKDLYDYDMVKNCCRCKLICSKSTFYKNIKREDEIQPMCKICMNNFIKKYMKKK